MPLSAVSSVSGLLATYAPSTPLSPLGLDSVIEQYMRSTLRPEAFITLPQSLSPPGLLEEPVTSSYWMPNIDPDLPLLDPAVSHSYSL